MTGLSKKHFLILIVCLVLFSAAEIPTGFFKAKLFLLFAPENSLIIGFNAYPGEKIRICADGKTPIILNVSLYDSRQNPVPFSLIHVKLNNFEGTVKPAYPITGKDGRVLISIYPDPILGENGAVLGEANVSVTLGAGKSGTIRWEGSIIPPPVLLVHGFQDTSESMVPLKNFLEERGLRVYLMDYSTETDMETMADELELRLNDIQAVLAEEGIYAGKTDIVCHSLGGLVARYYSTRLSYIQKNNLRKLFFINVPHHGTPWAEAGAAILGSPFLSELYPTGPLYTQVFPGSINKGLNHNIQVANIALENDEVVPIPSSSLASWNIGTKIYRIGSEPLTLESVISNQIGGGSRHRQILFYTPVFEQILHYLTSELPYPQERR